MSVDQPSSRLIAVLQMGKVASWTVVKTIQEAKHDIRLCTLKTSTEVPDAIVQLHDPRVFKRYLHESNTPTRDINVVTLVRDPLKNAIAAMFQNIIEGGHPFCCFGTMDDVMRSSGNDLVAFFRKYVAEEFVARFEDYTRMYGSALNIDAYNLHYDASGVAAGSFAFGRYIVIRLHCLEAALPHLSAMLSLSLTRCSNANLASEKWYAPAYARFFDAFHPSEDELQAFYGSRFARSNFTPADLNGFIAAWSAHGPARDLAASVRMGDTSR